MSKHLDNQTKSNLLEALQPEGYGTDYQQAIVNLINQAVMGSDDAEELIERLKEGTGAFFDAIVVVRQELKLEAKNNIDFLSIDKQGEYAKKAPKRKAN